jgi:hypothetical protein
MYSSYVLLTRCFEHICCSMIKFPFCWFTNSVHFFLQTNLPEFEGPEKIVIRRYSDFEWLHDRLAKKYKGIFIPPLPEKNAVGKMEDFKFHGSVSLIVLSG